MIPCNEPFYTQPLPLHSQTDPMNRDLETSPTLWAPTPIPFPSVTLSSDICTSWYRILRESMVAESPHFELLI
uniref:Uncharacterized protein n=1 Tax=Kalanchoe fedtschenkoi TaxID=63787 RepID=A0A7N0V8X4_KALFE